MRRRVGYQRTPVAPFSTNFAILFARILPQGMWDWAMRSVAFLNKKTLGLDGEAGRAPACGENPLMMDRLNG